MSGATIVRKLGNQVVVTYEDGSRARGVPTGLGVWIISTPAQGGTGTGSTGGPVVGGSDVPDPLDDYPWPNGPVDTLSPLRYGYRECVDFVAWRLNRDKGCTSAPWKYDWGDLRLTNGDAIGWKHDWELHGWGTDLPPAPGRIGWFGSKAGALGHVDYVQKVNADGSVVLEEYNWGANHHAYNTRTESPGSPYFPDSFLSAPPA
jgi:peptidoglycan DL-endopeptidase CwlO